jgi:hypothetical protein
MYFGKSKRRKNNRQRERKRKVENEEERKNLVIYRIPCFSLENPA